MTTEPVMNLYGVEESYDRPRTYSIVEVPILQETSKQFRVKSARVTDFRSVVNKDDMRLLGHSAEQAWEKYESVIAVRLSSAQEKVNELTRTLKEVQRMRGQP